MKNTGYANNFFWWGCGQPRPQGTFPKAREKRPGDVDEPQGYKAQRLCKFTKTKKAFT